MAFVRQCVSLALGPAQTYLNNRQKVVFAAHRFTLFMLLSVWGIVREKSVGGLGAQKRHENSVSPAL